MAIATIQPIADSLELWLIIVWILICQNYNYRDLTELNKSVNERSRKLNRQILYW